MFDVNNKDIIVKLIMTKDDDIVIPLYVKIYNMRYSILELNDITDFDASSFKVGFGTSTSFLLKNSFPDKNIFDFDNISTFIEFDEKLNSNIIYRVFESAHANGGDVVHKQINKYYEMLNNYVSNLAIEKKKELINKTMEEYSS